MGATMVQIAQQPEPEVPVASLVVSVGFLLVSALWVYFDAKSIGARKGLVGGIANNSPLVWAIGTVLMWIVVVPIYLFNRSKIQRAAAARQQSARPSWGAAQVGWSEVGWGSPSHAPAAQQPPPGLSPHSPHSLTPTPVSPPAGWYIDPDGSGYQRWWDGTKWTEHLAPRSEIPPSREQ